MSSEVELPQQQLEQTRSYIAIASLLIGVFAMSWTPILIRLSESEISPISTTFWREAIPSVLFGLWVSFQSLARSDSEEKSSEHESDQNIGRSQILLVAASISATFSVVLFAWALTQTTVANSTVIHSLVPLFTSLGAWLVFFRSFSRQFLIGMVVAMVGAIGIGLEDLQISLNNLQGDVMSLVSMILYSAYLLVVEKLRTKIDTATILLWRCTVGAVVLLPILLIARDTIFPFSINGWLFVIALALVSQVIGQGLVAYSLKKVSSGFVALSFLLIPALSAILAWFIFAENLSLLNWLSFFIILLGIYLAVSNQEVVNK
ncbi:MAG: DMT family transporter [Microcoleaceae cyanobacterium]